MKSLLSVFRAIGLGTALFLSSNIGFAEVSFVRADAVEIETGRNYVKIPSKYKHRTTLFSGNIKVSVEGETLVDETIGSESYFDRIERLLQSRLQNALQDDEGAGVVLIDPDASLWGDRFIHTRFELVDDMDTVVNILEEARANDKVLRTGPSKVLLVDPEAITVRPVQFDTFDRRIAVEVYEEKYGASRTIALIFGSTVNRELNNIRTRLKYAKKVLKKRVAIVPNTKKLVYLTPFDLPE